MAQRQVRLLADIQAAQEQAREAHACANRMTSVDSLFAIG